MKTPDEIKKGLRHCSDAVCKRCPYENDCHISYGGSESAADALEYIRQLEKHVPKWISVDERLPEYLGWVLVIGHIINKRKKRNYGWCVPHIAEYRHGRWCDSDGMLPDLEDRSLKITHWMPLPEPPKEG